MDHTGICAICNRTASIKCWIDYQHKFFCSTKCRNIARAKTRMPAGQAYPRNGIDSRVREDDYRHIVAPTMSRHGFNALLDRGQDEASMLLSLKYLTSKLNEQIDLRNPSKSVLSSESRLDIIRVLMNVGCVFVWHSAIQQSLFMSCIIQRYLAINSFDATIMQGFVRTTFAECGGAQYMRHYWVRVAGCDLDLDSAVLQFRCASLNPPIIMGRSLCIDEPTTLEQVPDDLRETHEAEYEKIMRDGPGQYLKGVPQHLHDLHGNVMRVLDASGCRVVAVNKP